MTINEFMKCFDNLARKDSVLFNYHVGKDTDCVKFYGFNEGGEDRYNKAKKVSDHMEKIGQMPKEVDEALMTSSDYFGVFCLNKEVKILTIKFDNKGFGR